MLARILYLSCIRYNHCRVCATWLERDVSLPGCMRIKSVTRYRLSSLQPPRSSSAISQIQTNVRPPSLLSASADVYPLTDHKRQRKLRYVVPPTPRGKLGAYFELDSNTARVAAHRDAHFRRSCSEDDLRAFCRLHVCPSTGSNTASWRRLSM